MFMLFDLYMVHALVSCRLDLNNALFLRLSQCLFAKIQRCQNIAAHIVTCHKTCHITPILREFHWLPGRYSIHYKVLLHVYRALNILSPDYLASTLALYAPSRPLRSASSRLLTVPRTEPCCGDRAFSKADPVLWNGLPLFVRSAPSLEGCRRQLKMVVFSRA